MAVIQGDGQIVHLKGQVALDQQGKIVGAGDMRAQVRKVLENIQSVLKSMGGRMSDVVSLIHHANVSTVLRELEHQAQATRQPLSFSSASSHATSAAATSRAMAASRALASAMSAPRPGR